jgi:hypothetical protein
VSQDVGDDCAHVLKHLAGGDPQCPETLVCQPFVSGFVVSWIGAPVMGLAVDLDRKLRLEAGEIEDERWTGRVLLAELEARLLTPQLTPQ